MQNQDKVKLQTILDMDASQMAKEIGAGKLSSVEATKAYIEHIQYVNPRINCLVENRFSLALEEAEAADIKIQEGTAKGTLIGVPFSMKEAFDVSGMKTTGGLMHRRDTIAQHDAEVVAKLRAEGAIILGKTNTPGLCFCQESDNKLYGRTNNPWNIDKTAGGSSGGEAALIAVGGAAAGIGSDIGGSIRFPSHFNGVIGFKSGKGKVSQHGSFPAVEHPLQERMFGIGPISKTIADTKLIYNIIAKEAAPQANLEEFKIEILPKTSYPLTHETAILMNKIREKLRRSLQIEEHIPPYFQESAVIWQEAMSIDGGKTTAEAALMHRSLNPAKEFLKEKLTGKSDYHYYLSWALIGTRLFKPSAKRVQEIERTILAGDQFLREYLKKRILILPVYHRTAPNHGDLYRELFSIKKTFKMYMPYVAYANTWGLPALTMPVGNDSEGMPIGVQLISQNGNEDAVFQLGEILENEFGGYKRCEAHDRKKVQS
ncbi:amidase [Lederbergia citrea]|nr:amidase [Lederbergia citrea]